jgi:hypothetical protein
MIVVLFAAPAAFAQQPAASQPARTVEFNPEEVKGGTHNPNEALETVRRRRRLDSLVRIRTDFRQKMLQSVETF